MKKALAIVTLSTLLSACAGMAPTNSTGNTSGAKETSTDQSATAATKSDETKTSIAGKTADEHLPAVELSGEILFKAVVAHRVGNVHAIGWPQG
ncbi:tetratricopeptide repeat protein, partial [Glaciimonas sp. GG7]